uniref:Uncharacterized protein n=1 Tax=Arundo donax TaxID=35708 RepID=A0A0A9BB43_ARUDO
MFFCGLLTLVADVHVPGLSSIDALNDAGNVSCISCWTRTLMQYCCLFFTRI